MRDRTWEDIEGEIRGDYLRANGPENVRFRESQWKVWLASVERAAAEEAIKALEIELVGSMGDGTFIAPWVEIPAGELREKIWAVFDSYGAAALGLTAGQEGDNDEG